MDTIVKRTFNITSSESRFKYKFTRMNSGEKYDRICITSVSIPKTYYLLPAATTLSVVDENGSFDITIPLGNYNAESMRTLLETELQAASASVGYSVSHPIRSDTVSTSTYTISASNVTGAAPQFTITAAHYLLAEVLGFTSTENEAQTLTMTLVGSAGSLTFPRVINFQRYDSLAIVSPQIMDSVACVINSNGTPYNSSIIFNASDLFVNSRPIEQVNSDSIEFALVNAFDLDEEINLNGVKFEFEVVLWRMKQPSMLVSQITSMLAKLAGIGVNEIDENPLYAVHFSEQGKTPDQTMSTADTADGDVEEAGDGEDEKEEPQAQQQQQFSMQAALLAAALGLDTVDIPGMDPSIIRAMVEAKQKQDEKQPPDPRSDYLKQIIQLKIAAGMTPEDAQSAAVRELAQSLASLDTWMVAQNGVQTDYYDRRPQVASDPVPTLIPIPPQDGHALVAGYYGSRAPVPAIVLADPGADEPPAEQRPALKRRRVETE